MSGTPERKGHALNIVLGICLILWIITTAVLILPAWHNYRSLRAEEEKQQSLLTAAKEERQKQQERRSRLERSPAEVEKVARENYNLVRKGEVIMSYPPEKKSSGKQPVKKAEKNPKKNGNRL